MDHASLFQLGEGGIPEFQVKDFAFTGKQLVSDVEARHRAQMEANNRVGYDRAHRRRFAMTFFDGFQSCGTQRGGLRFVLFIKLRDLGVQVPTPVVKAGLRCKCADFGERFLSHVLKADDDVGDLHAGVVDIVLHLDVFTGVAQDTCDRVAQNGVANVADMRGLVGVNAGVFDDDFFRRRGRFGRRCCHCALQRPPERGAVKESVEVAGAGHFEQGDSRNGWKAGGNFLSNLAGRALQALGQLKTNGRSRFAEFELRWFLQNDGNVNRVFLANVICESSLQSLEELEIHLASVHSVGNLQYRKCRRERSKGMLNRPACKRSGTATSHCCEP